MMIIDTVLGRHVKNFTELDFTAVAEVHSYRVDFKIYHVMSWEWWDDNGHHERPLWVRAGSTGGGDDVQNLEEAEIYLHGEVKWDGCSNWHFDEQDRVMLHGCSRSDIQRFGDVMAACWDWAMELLPNSDGVR
ncbi:hypothetical protein [Burkholderia sp. BCC0405]|uniref:hypothetical protein n=1 Tax=Burkholderia sp. BCC0405 TaxID=2676298 RepID=UPI001588FD2F|nr:hypothetical protein [Burkholderia sp. BCC0405]